MYFDRYYDIEEDEEPAEGEAPPQEDCKGCIVFGTDPTINDDGPAREGMFPVAIHTSVENNKGKSNFCLYSKTPEGAPAVPPAVARRPRLVMNGWRLTSNII